MTISADRVKELRNRTGVGIMDCKGALKESSGDIDAAMELLRKRELPKKRNVLDVKLTKE